MPTPEDFSHPPTERLSAALSELLTCCTHMGLGRTLAVRRLAVNVDMLCSRVISVAALATISDALDGLFACLPLDDAAATERAEQLCERARDEIAVLWGWLLAGPREAA